MCIRDRYMGKEKKRKKKRKQKTTTSMAEETKMQLVESRLIDDQFYFETIHFLGKGMYGKVYKGVDRLNNDYPVAIKVIDLTAISKKENVLKSLRNEINTMEKLKSQTNHNGFKNLVRPIAIKKTKNNLYMISEYCEGGNVESYIKSKGGYLSETESIKLMRGVIQGFKVLRDCNIIHRDMKPENILLANGIPKIADFGFSRFTEDSDEFFMMVTLLGSPLYMAPQILKKHPYTVKCDIFSLGVMFFQMIFGVFPWPANSPAELIHKIETKPLTIPAKPQISDMTRDFLLRSLVFDEKSRLEWAEVFTHPLFTNRIDETKKSLEGINSIQDEFKKTMAKNALYTKESMVIENSDDIKELQLKFIAGKMEEELSSGEAWNASKMCDENKDSGANSGNNVELAANYSKTYQKQQEEIKKRLEMKICSNRVAYERNKIFFINIIISDKLTNNISKLNMTTQHELFLKMLFVLTKYLLIRMGALRSILNQKANVFNLPAWDEFCKSKEFQDYQNLIKIDITMYEDFFKIVFTRCKDVATKSDTFATRNQEFMKILNDDLKDDPAFTLMFNMGLYEFLVYLKPFVVNNPTDRQLLLLADYMLVCVRKLSETFPLNNQCEYDFNKFYENKEKGDTEQLYKDVLDKFRFYKLQKSTQISLALQDNNPPIHPSLYLSLSLFRKKSKSLFVSVIWSACHDQATHFQVYDGQIIKVILCCCFYRFVIKLCLTTFPWRWIPQLHINP
eukprot:TRINITY_DN1864_c0_g1_i1.p1 TRINITY_DN1864_c0_g1~~TRINITY_DN1864_c0_g1_i1.p1  ORF type:complete len:736 (-),score=195.35 TRINITY_DN1864_c0_g1_i1:680-2887(-)